MNRIILLLPLLLIISTTQAQEKVKQKEIGITFKNLDNFGLSYKFGNINRMWRVGTFMLDGHKSTLMEPDKNDKEINSKGFELSFGREYRKAINSKIDFRYGLDVFYSWKRTKKKDVISSYSFNPFFSEKNSKTGLRLIFGMNYKLADNLILGAEILPTMAWARTKLENSPYKSKVEVIQEIETFEYDLSNASAILTLAFQF